MSELCFPPMLNASALTCPHFAWMRLSMTACSPGACGTVSHGPIIAVLLSNVFRKHQGGKPRLHRCEHTRALQSHLKHSSPRSHQVWTRMFPLWYVSSSFEAVYPTSHLWTFDGHTWENHRKDDTLLAIVRWTAARLSTRSPGRRIYLPAHDTGGYAHAPISYDHTRRCPCTIACAAQTSECHVLLCTQESHTLHPNAGLNVFHICSFELWPPCACFPFFAKVCKRIWMNLRTSGLL
jgi:hypothetical protein